MSMIYTILTLLVIVEFFIIIGLVITRTSIDIEEVEKEILEEHKVSMMVDLQSNYPGLTQLKFLARWISCVKEKIQKETTIPERKMLKDVVNEL